VTKATIVLMGYILIVLSTILCALFVNEGAAALVAAGLTLALVVFCARRFRGEEESDAPRAWWRLSSTPVTGFVLGVLFAAPSVVAIPTSPDAAFVGVSILYALIGLAFISSSLTLIAQRRNESPGVGSG